MLLLLLLQVCAINHCVCFMLHSVVPGLELLMKKIAVTAKSSGDEFIFSFNQWLKCNAPLSSSSDRRSDEKSGEWFQDDINRRVL